VILSAASITERTGVAPHLAQFRQQSRRAERSLRGGMRVAARGVRPLILSAVYESDAVGFVGEPFLEPRRRAESRLAGRAVQRRLREIEDAHWAPARRESSARGH